MFQLNDFCPACTVYGIVYYERVNCRCVFINSDSLCFMTETAISTAHFQICFQVPMLVPGLTYEFDTFVDCLNDRGVAESVKVDECSILLTAFICE